MAPEQTAKLQDDNITNDDPDIPENVAPGELIIVVV
jgi:hypothetical protein